MPDQINNPAHYNAHPDGMECIELVERMGFCEGNAIKYLWRAGLKGARADDLKKALWYVRRAEESPVTLAWDQNSGDNDTVHRAIKGFDAVTAAAMVLICDGVYEPAARLIEHLIAAPPTEGA